MRAGQVARAHEEFAGNLAAREAERLPEELHPFRLRQRMMRIQPGGEAAVLVPETLHASCILDYSVHLQTVPYNGRISEEPGPFSFAIAGDDVDIESLERPVERVLLLQDGQPGQPRLVDLQRQPFEELGVRAQREAVLAVMVGPMPRMAGRNVAVAGQGCLLGTQAFPVEGSKVAWNDASRRPFRPPSP